MSLSGLSTLFTWLSICLCHIRFRRAWKVQGHSTDELPFRAMGGQWGSWFGVVLIFLVLVAQLYVAIWPLDGQAETSAGIAEGFFGEWLLPANVPRGLPRPRPPSPWLAHNMLTDADIPPSFLNITAAYLAVPVMILFYVGGYAWKRTLPRRAHEIDLDSGRKSWLTAEEMNEWRAERKRAPWYVRMYRILFTN